MGRNNAINNVGLAFTASTFVKAGSYVQGVQLNTADVVTGLSLSSATISATGTDANIDINLVPKNTGVTVLATGLTVTTGPTTINSGLQTIAIGNDATAASINLGTGAGAKLVTVGSTSSTSQLSLKYGAATMAITNASGTVMSANSSGEITYPLQPAFSAVNTTNPTNVTGDATEYTVVFDTEIFDQSGNFASNTFTAPVTGKYFLNTGILSQQGTATILFVLEFLTSNRPYFLGNNGTSSTGNNAYSYSVLADMDAADTCTVVFIGSGGSKVVDIYGHDTGDVRTFFQGFLVC